MVRKLVFGLILTAVTVFGANIHAPQASAAVSDWQKGVSMQARGPGDFNTASFRQSVDKAAAAGANDVGLVVQVYQSNQYSSDVQAGYLTPSDADLGSAIRYIRSKGMGATVKLHVDTYNGQWRATINPTDRPAWFANYGGLLNRFAAVAQANGATGMIVGTEMTSLTMPQYNAGNTAGWQKMISDVRARFNGKLSYSAQHDGYMPDTNLQFWGSLDYIGLSAYYGLGNSNDVNSLINNWNNINNNYIRVLNERYGKPVMFTEIGYQSKQGSVASPGDSYARGGATDMTEQANAYQAFFQYWNNYSFVKGVAWWDWSTDPNAGGTNNNDYTPQNKPAEAVMKQWFGTAVAPVGGQGGGTTTPTNPTTPTQPTQPTVSSTYSVTGSNTTATNGVALNSTVNVKASQTTGGMLVDVEIYDRNNNRVFQKFYENQTLGTTGSDYTVNWTPTTSGDYRIAVGVFSANWQANLLWTDKVATVTSAALAPVTPTQPTTPTVPTQPTTPTTPTTPTQPTQPTTPATKDVSIWWPGTGVTVSGVQPFKARIDSLNVSQYKMYWQVDGDRLNELGDSYETVDHKESQVDLTGWNWKASKQYTITFVAKDLAGNIIGKKDAVITIN